MKTRILLVLALAASLFAAGYVLSQSVHETTQTPATTTASTSDHNISNSTSTTHEYHQPIPPPVQPSLTQTQQTQVAILKQLIALLEKLATYYQTIERQEHDLNSITIHYNHLGQPQVTIDDTGGSHTWPTESVDEQIILTTIALAYDLQLREVAARTSFDYAVVPKGSFPYDVTSGSTKTVGGRMIVSLHAPQQTYSYWFNTTNSRIAAEQLADIYRVPTKTVWDVLLAG